MPDQTEPQAHAVVVRKARPDLRVHQSVCRIPCCCRHIVPALANFAFGVIGSLGGLPVILLGTARAVLSAADKLRNRSALIMETLMHIYALGEPHGP